MASRRPSDRSDQDRELTAEVLRQQQALLVQRIPVIAQMSAFYGLIVLIGCWTPGGRLVEPLSVWFALVAAASTILLLSRLSRRPASSIGPGALDAARFWAAGLGGLWSSTVYLFYTAEPARILFLSAVIAGLAAGTVAFLASIPRVNQYFLFALLVPFAARVAVVWDVLHLAVVGLCFLYGAALMYGSWESYNTLVELVRSHKRLDKARSDLEDAIESTNDAFALLDEKRLVVTANSRFRDWFAGAQRVWGGDAKGQVRKLQNGRWVVSTIRPTSRGGWVSVHVDVSALKAREEELLAAKLRAEEADRAKSRFLASMSHELRTPLNAIIGFSQMMRDQALGPLGDARYKTYADDIWSSGRHLLSIINDILDMSKVEDSRSGLVFEPVDLPETIAWCVSVCLAREESRPRDIQVDVDSQARWLDADRRALRQILINLLANALKFTPPDKPVGLRAAASEEGGIAITVWDKGIGIPADKVGEVKKPFFQVESSLAKRFQGAGLGLAIADTLVRCHGGELLVESVEGRGSTFTVRLPPERVSAPPAPAPLPAPGAAIEAPAGRT